METTSRRGGMNIKRGHESLERTRSKWRKDEAMLLRARLGARRYRAQPVPPLPTFGPRRTDLTRRALLLGQGVEARIGVGHHKACASSLRSDLSDRMDFLLKPD